MVERAFPGEKEMTHKLLGPVLAAEAFSADLRQAIRQICKAPAFSASVVLLLAAGFGISVAVFSVVRNVLLKFMRQTGLVL
jgi:hypothetical protein